MLFSRAKIFTAILCYAFAATGFARSGASDKRAMPKKPGSSISLGQQTLWVGGLMGVSMAILWQLPESFTQWSHTDELSLWERYNSNISKGPVWDGDLRFFNAYSHIHVGAAYQVMCLAHGYSSAGCFLYTNAMSLAWEYGPEAFKEIPSWQDILMTGPVGARVGEIFSVWRNRIERNDGKVLGSKILGSVCGFLLDPAGQLTRGLYDGFGLMAHVDFAGAPPALAQTGQKKPEPFWLRLTLPF